jgi:hypothetical protein
MGAHNPSLKEHKYLHGIPKMGASVTTKRNKDIFIAGAHMISHHGDLPRIEADNLGPLERGCFATIGFGLRFWGRTNKS